MTEPRFERVLDELGHAAEHAWADITRHKAATAVSSGQHPTPATEAPAMTTTDPAPAAGTSVLSELHDKIADGIKQIEGWAGELRARLPEFAATAARIDANPIVQDLIALGEAELPPEYVTMIRGLIALGAKVIGTAGDSGAPPVPGDGSPVIAPPADSTTPPATGAAGTA